ncbi:MAG: hypothetical protein U5L96_08650 [Owenweeksia sp.]|nr:hypothetical protein [Owenweeksia sp.]
MLADDLHQLMSGQAVHLQAYRPHPGQETSSKTYQYQGEDVVLIEGVVALATEELRSLAHYKVFMSIKEETLKKRFEAFYRWKEFEKAEMDKLWQTRWQNEYQPIATNEKHADLVVA